jgi:hypothetical protein
MTDGLSNVGEVSHGNRMRVWKEKVGGAENLLNRTSVVRFFYTRRSKSRPKTYVQRTRSCNIRNKLSKACTEKRVYCFSMDEKNATPLNNWWAR